MTFDTFDTAQPKQHSGEKLPTMTMPYFCRSCGDTRLSNFSGTRRGECNDCNWRRHSLLIPLPKPPGHELADYFCLVCAESLPRRFYREKASKCMVCLTREQRAVRSKRGDYCCECGKVGRPYFSGLSKHICRSCLYEKNKLLLYTLCVEVQGKFCAICKKTIVELDVKKLEINGDPSTGTVRGLLCFPCWRTVLIHSLNPQEGLADYLEAPPLLHLGLKI